MNSWESDDAHRPWPMPRKPWTMRHSWHDLTFLHWPVSVATLRPLIPQPLTIDTFDGDAWIGVVPFSMDFRVRNMPKIPWLGAFSEINVRTYVRLNDKPGVWFLSLDCSSRIVTTVARTWYGLPYFNANTRVEIAKGPIRYLNDRCNGHGIARFDALVLPGGRPSRSKPDTLAHWLTERYCLYATRRSSSIIRADIQHAPWNLQEADMEVHSNTMTEPLGIKLSATQPIAHFARRMDVLVWPPEPVD
ncbi:MAG: DUF2071 domain-containing protein [Planctomycetes bacterium]|nr:DUF2071 domain-containing protein [Planctomycetota bacterium]MBI3833539.1 DUF2071 domain-containing protein [Planctomycetota bacterium]